MRVEEEYALSNLLQEISREAGERMEWSWENRLTEIECRITNGKKEPGRPRKMWSVSLSD